jgi:hypothetical protein
MAIKRTETTEPTNVEVILPGNIKALVITWHTDFKRNWFTVYYSLSDGQFLLKDESTRIGLRSVEVHQGNIFCIWKSRETARQEFCGFFDEKGNELSQDQSFTIPERLRERIRQWCVRFKKD